MKQAQGKKRVTRLYSTQRELLTAGIRLELQQHGRASTYSKEGRGVLLSLCCRMLYPSHL